MTPDKEDEKDQNETQSPLPEAVQERLRELAAKLEAERSSLNEAELMREAEVTSLQTEFNKREEAWDRERITLNESLSALKAEKESFEKEREQFTILQETIASLEAELKKREEAWVAQRNQLKADLDRVKEELRAERKQVSETGAEWQRKLEQLAAASKQGAEREAKLREQLLSAENALKETEREKERLEDEHSKELGKLEIKHQKQMLDALGAVDSLLGKEGKKNSKPR